MEGQEAQPPVEPNEVQVATGGESRGACVSRRRKLVDFMRHLPQVVVQIYLYWLLYWLSTRVRGLSTWVSAVAESVAGACETPGRRVPRKADRRRPGEYRRGGQSRAPGMVPLLSRTVAVSHRLQLVSGLSCLSQNWLLPILAKLPREAVMVDTHFPAPRPAMADRFKTKKRRLWAAFSRWVGPILVREC